MRQSVDKSTIHITLLPIGECEVRRRKKKHLRGRWDHCQVQGYLIGKATLKSLPILLCLLEGREPFNFSIIHNTQHNH